MRRQLLPAVLVFLTMSVLAGVVYPLTVSAVARVAFPRQAEGSLVTLDGTTIGSELIGQAFDGPEWFMPRPSAAGDGYDASSSGASNLGPTNPELLTEVELRVNDYRSRNGLAPEVAVPVDAVTASASGLDPHISVANARLQAPRVAEARGLPLDEVLGLVDEHTEQRPLGVLGDQGVNVLLLNRALERVGGSR